MRNREAPLPYLLCEVANSHGGDAAIVRSLISEFGALSYSKKGIKFQVFQADTIALSDFPWYAVYEELSFDEDTWSTLIRDAAVHGDVWVDMFDLYGVEILRRNVDSIAGLKFQASVLENEEVIDELRALDLSSKFLIVNVSGFQVDEIGRFVKVFEELSSNIVLQIGFQAYPTEIQHTALQKIAILRAAFPGYALGMADHADGSSDFAQLAPVYASLLGCAYLEKHFCMRRADAKYDAFSALEPDELSRLCRRLEDVSWAGTGEFVAPPEKRYLASSVQAPVMRHQLAAGQRIALRDLLFRRTAQVGISWNEVNALQKERMRIGEPVGAKLTVSRDKFKPARVGAIVACRMKSTRLPKKAVLPIAGVPSVERCLYQCLAMEGVDQVILATSNLPEDGLLSDYLCDGSVGIFQGDPDDVISRYLHACEQFGIDVIVRVTADCPLVSVEVAEYLLESHFRTGADYTAAVDAAVGTACEVIETSALRTVIDYLGQAKYSEYMTWYFRNNPDIFQLNITDLPRELVRGYRLTLDHPEDLEVFESVFMELGGERKAIGLPEVLKLLDSRPDIAERNAHLELKYVSDQELIALLNSETRILRNRPNSRL